MMDAFFRLDMKAATQAGGCPVCALIAHRTDRYLRFFLTENVIDPIGWMQMQQVTRQRADDDFHKGNGNRRADGKPTGDQCQPHPLCCR